MSSSTITRPRTSAQSGGVQEQLSTVPGWIAAIWVAFGVGSLLAFDAIAQATWSWTVPVVAGGLLLVGWSPPPPGRG